MKGGNEIVEADCLIYAHLPKVEAISIDFGTKLQLNILNWVLKLETRKLSRFYTSDHGSPNRIEQATVKELIKKNEKKKFLD